MPTGERPNWGKIINQKEPPDPIFVQFLNGEIGLDVCEKRCHELYQDPDIADGKFKRLQTRLVINQYSSGKINYDSFQERCGEIYPDDTTHITDAIKDLRKILVVKYIKGKISLENYNQLISSVPLVPHHIPGIVSKEFQPQGV